MNGEGKCGDAMGEKGKGEKGKEGKCGEGKCGDAKGEKGKEANAAKASAAVPELSPSATVADCRGEIHGAGLGLRRAFLEEFALSPSRADALH